MLHRLPILFHKETFLYFNQNTLSEKVKRNSYTFRWGIHFVTWNIFNIAWNRLNGELNISCLKNSLTALLYLFYSIYMISKKKWRGIFTKCTAIIVNHEYQFCYFWRLKNNTFLKICSLLLELSILMY